MTDRRFAKTHALGRVAQHQQLVSGRSPISSDGIKTGQRIRGEFGLGLRLVFRLNVDRRISRGRIVAAPRENDGGGDHEQPKSHPQIIRPTRHVGGWNIIVTARPVLARSRGII